MSDNTHVWVKARKALGQIAIARTASDHECFAAEEMAKYLGLISGVKVPVVKGLRKRERPSLIIVDASRPAHAEFIRDIPVSDLEHDGFIIRSVGPDVYVVSMEASGVVYGTYQYLTRVLGVTFYDYAPQGEDIPYLDTIEHGPVDIIRNPRLSFRGMQGTYALKRIDWMAKNGFNWTRLFYKHANRSGSFDWWDKNSPPLVAELKKRGIRIAFGHHLFHMILPDDIYIEDHPDYFPMVDGKPVWRPQFRWSLKNPDVMKEVIFRLEEFLSRHPEIEIIDFWPTDGLCDIEDDEYVAMTGELPKRGEWEKTCSGKAPIGRLGDPNKARVYALLTKTVAEALAPRFPNLKMSTLYYTDLIEPCPDVELPDNVIMGLVPYWRCRKHSLFDDRCDYNSQYKQAFEALPASCGARSFHIYEYYMGMGAQVSLPYPCITSMFKEWPRLMQLGVCGTTVQSSDAQAVPYNVNYLAFLAIAWGNASSVEEYLTDYCKGYFGEVWEYVFKMYMLWEEGCQNAPADTQPSSAFLNLIFTDEELVQCRELLDQAMHSTNDPKLLFRISRLIILTEYARKVLELCEFYYPAAVDQRRGKPIDHLEKSLLPMLKPMSDYARRLAELGLEISSLSVPTEFKREEPGPPKPSKWESLRAKILKEEWVAKEFDPDVIEKALGRKKRS